MKQQKKNQDKGKQKLIPKVNLTKSTEKPSKNKMIIWLALICLISMISFSPSLKNGITNWDDDQYVEKNPWLQELSKENLKSIFSEYYMGNYHPLAMLSLSLDFKIGGLDKKDEIKPFVYHFTNLVLHLFNTLLVFWLIFLFFDRFEVAIIASVLFGISTLHVESVAWISERKDVLYAFFFIAALIAWVYYVKLRKTQYYAFALILFILSLFSKGQAVSLAVTLFAIDFLFERKLLDKKVLLEKIPFFALALIFGIIAVKAQQAGNALHDADSYEFYKRIGFAGYAFTQYIVKLLAPVGLSAIYPYPDIINKSVPSYYWLFMIPALMVVYAFFYYLKRSKVVAFCISFFVINIFLLLQLIPVGSAIWADRYSYIPSIGYYALAAWLTYQAINKLSIRKTIVYSFLGIYLTIIAIASFNRCKIWNNSMSLWDDTVEKSPKAVVAWNNRGSMKDKDKKHAEAIEDFTRAIVLKPDYTHAFYNRGTAKKNLAEELKDSLLVKSAIKDFDSALKFDPKFVEAFHNRALSKENLSEYTRSDSQRNALLNSALDDYNKTVELNPKYENALVNRGVIKGKLNRFNEAIDDFNLAISLTPDNAQAYSNRGLANDFKGDYKSAIEDYNKAIELNPNLENAYLNRGIVFRKLKNYLGSVQDFSKAIDLDPKISAAYYFRGLDLILTNHKDEGCRDLEKAVKLGHPDAKKQYEINCNK